MLHMTLRYWACIYSLVEGVFKSVSWNQKFLPSINRYPIYKEKSILEKNKNKTQFSLVKNQLMVYQNE